MSFYTLNLFELQQILSYFTLRFVYSLFTSVLHINTSVCESKSTHFHVQIKVNFLHQCCHMCSDISEKQPSSPHSNDIIIMLNWRKKSSRFTNKIKINCARINRLSQTLRGHLISNLTESKHVLQADIVLTVTTGKLLRHIGGFCIKTQTTVIFFFVL